jgi:hypothetical protein
LRSNTFTNNFINPQGAGNYAGGNVVFEPCADTVEISGNTMTGPPVNPDGTPHTLGLELWGRNITVTGNNNISGFPNEGIVLASVYNATVSGNTVANNDQEVPSHPLNPDPYKTGGISISTFGPGACDQIPRDSQNIVITGNTSTGQAYGVSFMDRGAARNTMEAVTIDSSNTLLGNTDYPIAILSPIIGLIPTLTQAHQLEPLGVDTPRALAPDAVSPVQSRCSTPGSDRETFTFSASDVQGPGAITSIEVRFVTGGANDTGNPGNTAGACGFVYSYAPTFGTDPPFNLVTLETDSGLWPESVVGPGGSDIANGYCTIHAGSPASHVATDPKTLNVTLDIDFLPSSGKRYIYAWVTNTQGTFSNGGTWKYWGWWQIP